MEFGRVEQVSPVADLVERERAALPGRGGGIQEHLGNSMALGIRGGRDHIAKVTSRPPPISHLSSHG